MARFKDLAIAVIEPQYEINLGYIARVMGNFGLRKMYLVNPKVDLDKAKVFASHASNIIDEAFKMDYKSLIKNFDLIVGTTALESKKPSKLKRKALSLEEFSKDFPNLPSNLALILGRDTTGLTNEELEKCDLILHIHTKTAYESLNISHALAIILYELSKLKGKRIKSTASRKEKEVLINWALNLAKASNFPEYKLPFLKKSLKNLISKATNFREVSLLTGLFRKALISIKKEKL
ncbi:MAG: RNA methyltransferase [Nitrososphaerales archaeon]